MSTRQATIVLEGGLGNRMRVAASAYAMQQQLHLPIGVLWTSQWGMRCRFDSLFEAVSMNDFTLRDARGTERLLFARPQVSNLHLPSLLQRALYRHRILSSEIWYKNRDGFDYASWFRQGRVLMTAYRDFCPWTANDLNVLFQPTAEVARRIDERCSSFSASTIGLHIRRTDHQQAIDESPLSLFTEVVDNEVSQHADLSIYLATDDEATKAALRKRYGQRIITAGAEASRESTDGIREALVEMYALSRTHHIYGSAGSTFSPIAACLGHTPITILQRDGQGTVDLLLKH